MLPFAEKTAVSMPEPWPVNFKDRPAGGVPEFRGIVMLAVARVLPSGENATHLIDQASLRLASSRPVAASQSFNSPGLPSVPPLVEAIVFPSGENATDHTPASCPARVRRRLHLRVKARVLCIPGASQSDQGQGRDEYSISPIHDSVSSKIQKWDVKRSLRSPLTADTTRPNRGGRSCTSPGIRSNRERQPFSADRWRPITGRAKGLYRNSEAMPWQAARLIPGVPESGWLFLLTILAA